MSRRSLGGGAPRHTSWESRPGRRRAASMAWGCVAVAITITPVDAITITNADQRKVTWWMSYTVIHGQVSCFY